MAEVTMLFPYEPTEFWQQMKKMMEEVMEQKNTSTTPSQSANQSSPKQLLKAKEVCELFQVSKPTVYDWMNQGKLKSIKIRSRRFFLWQDIEELIKEGKSIVVSTASTSS